MSINDDQLYLFTGNAEIFIENRINRIISSYNKFKITITKYDLDAQNIARIIEDANTLPFLEDYKILILKNPQVLAERDLDKSFDLFIKYLKKPIDSTIIIIDAANIEIKESNPLYKALMNYAAIIDFSNSEEVEIKGWIKRTCSVHNIEITDEAISLFIEYLGDDQIRMTNELDKLVDYTGDFGVIEAKTIKTLVAKDLSNDIYNLIKAINNHDKDMINELFTSLISQTKDASGIIALLSNSLKDMLLAAKFKKRGYSQSDIAKALHISNGRAYYLIQDAQKYKLKDLERYVISLADLDYQIKSGQIDKNTGIELLLLKI